MWSHPLYHNLFGHNIVISFRGQNVTTREQKGLNIYGVWSSKKKKINGYERNLQAHYRPQGSTEKDISLAIAILHILLDLTRLLALLALLLLDTRAAWNACFLTSLIMIPCTHVTFKNWKYFNLHEIYFDFDKTIVNSRTKQ